LQRDPVVAARHEAAERSRPPRETAWRGAPSWSENVTTTAPEGEDRRGALSAARRGRLAVEQAAIARASAPGLWRVMLCGPRVSRYAGPSTAVKDLPHEGRAERAGPDDGAAEVALRSSQVTR